MAYVVLVVPDDVQDAAEWRLGGMRDPRFDVPVLVIGGVVTAALSVGLATAFLYLSRTSTGPDVGPTGATLGDALSTLSGAALGLAVGSGLTAGLARRGSRMFTGFVVGFAVYVAVLIPIIVFSEPSDVSAAESFGLALLLGIPLGLAVIVGSMIGATAGAGYTIIGKSRPRRRTPANPSR